MGPYRIVLADDHALIRQGLRKILGTVSDLEVVGEAGDGIELLSVLDDVTPDLVILDLSMPKLRGVEAIAEIKVKRHDVRILVLTMHKEYLHRALEEGADGYLLKEDADRDLFSAVENLRQGRIYVSPRLISQLLEEHRPEPDPLSPREREVLKLIVEGKSSREIGEELFISARTVESHRASILCKLDLKNTAELVRIAVQRGYV